MRLLIFFMLMGLSAPLSAQTNFEKLRAKFDAGEVFEAAFQHTYLDSYTQESTASDGQVWINKIGYKLKSESQYRWSISSIYASTKITNAHEVSWGSKQP